MGIGPPIVLVIAAMLESGRTAWLPDELVTLARTVPSAPTSQAMRYPAAKRYLTATNGEPGRDWVEYSKSEFFRQPLPRRRDNRADRTSHRTMRS